MLAMATSAVAPKARFSPTPSESGEIAPFTAIRNHGVSVVCPTLHAYTGAFFSGAVESPEMRNGDILDNQVDAKWAALISRSRPMVPGCFACPVFRSYLWRGVVDEQTASSAILIACAQDGSTGTQPHNPS